jgi:predicted nucleic acid-binding protein
MKKAVINSSPLILLFETELEFILPKIFSEIIVSDSVWREVCECGEDDRASKDLPNTHWIKKVNVISDSDIISWDLGKGETAVLGFAIKNNDYIVVADDKMARKCAEIYNLKLIGTGGLIVVAKKRGLLKNVSDPIDKLKKSGFYLSDEVVSILLKQAGEL